MQAERFRPYGPDHLAVLAILCASATLLIVNRRRLQDTDVPWVRRTVAGLLLGQGLYSWALVWLRGVRYVPCQFCDLTLIMTAAALWRPAPLISELVYFWGLTGSLQAILTPALEAPFSSQVWFTFFLDHLGIVLAAIYLAVGAWVRPTAGGAIRAWLLMHVYAAAAGLANWLTGTNYGFLARKPAQPSVLDFFGPWPWYIVVMDVAALLSFWLCAVPYAWRSRR